MQIHIHREGREFGPFTVEQVNEQVAAGQLQATDLAWHEGLADWVPLASIAGVQPVVPARVTPVRRRGWAYAATGAGLVSLGGLAALILFKGDRAGADTRPEPGGGGPAVKAAIAQPFDAAKVRARTDFNFAAIEPFLKAHCADCHDADTAKSGLDLYALGRDLGEPAAMTKWVRVHDLVASGKMPPEKKPRPEAGAQGKFLAELAASLTGADARRKGTVLRRLNRNEYENTLNDLFGTRVALADTLPEDGRAEGFENVGEVLSLSMVQLQRYLDGAEAVLEAAIATRLEKPESKVIRAGYADSRDSDQFIGKVWKKLADNAVVLFKRSGYPSGMIRGSNVRTPGRYRVRVTGYAYQSKEPVTFYVGGTTFIRGAAKPTYGYFQLPPGKPTTIEFEAWIEASYMIQIEPYGISDRNNELRNQGADKYAGPGIAIQQVELEGPLVDEFPSRGHQLVFTGLDRKEVEPRNPRDKQQRWYVPKFKVESANPVADATTVLRRVATKAFRRPVAVEQIKSYVELFETELKKEGDFETALRTALAAIFCAPDFLFLKEPPGRLDDFALASRLSYFLTRTAPDDALLAAAAAGKLTTDTATLLAETDRLLGGPHAERFARDFTDAWLDLRNIEFTNPDGRLYPEYDEFLLHSMLGETRSFFRELLRENLSIANFIDSDFAMLNVRLAGHYDVPNVRSPEFQKVSLPADSPRGGLMAQASILKVSANGTTTSPVLRGVWVLERVLGIKPSPPPPAVPGVEPDIRGAQTIRQQLDQHRNMVSCQGCHQLIDPPGFALEVFDPVGGYRERFRSIGAGDRVDKEIDGRRVNYKLGPVVDASGQLPDGRAFKDFEEFKQLLLASKEQVARCVTEKLLTFATGRELGFSDRPEVGHLVKQLGENGDGLRTLIHLIVQSRIFQTK